MYSNIAFRASSLVSNRCFLSTNSVLSDFRVKITVPILRHFDRHFAIITLQRLWFITVSRVRMRRFFFLRLLHLIFDFTLQYVLNRWPPSKSRNAACMSCGVSISYSSISCAMMFAFPLLTYVFLGLPIVISLLCFYSITEGLLQKAFHRLQLTFLLFLKYIFVYGFKNIFNPCLFTNLSNAMRQSSSFMTSLTSGSSFRLP